MTKWILILIATPVFFVLFNAFYPRPCKTGINELVASCSDGRCSSGTKRENAKHFFRYCPSQELSSSAPEILATFEKLLNAISPKSSGQFRLRQNCSGGYPDFRKAMESSLESFTVPAFKGQEYSAVPGNCIHFFDKNTTCLMRWNHEQCLYELVRLLPS